MMRIRPLEKFHRKKRHLTGGDGVERLSSMLGYVYVLLYWFTVLLHRLVL